MILNGAGVVLGGAIPASLALAARLVAPVGVGYQRNEKVRWEELSKVDFAGPGKKAKARFYLTD